jgi:hypothetical protein
MIRPETWKGLSMRAVLHPGRVPTVAALLVLVAACGTSLPEPRIPEPPRPLHVVDGAALPPVNFVAMEADVPGGRILGWHYEGEDYRRAHDYRWDANFANVTGELNAPSRDVLREAGFRVGRGGEDVVRMIGTITRLSYNSYARKLRFNQGEVAVRWSLFRPGEDRPYHTATTAGAARAEDIQAGAIVGACEVALRNLLADPGFAAAVAAGRER